MSLKKETKNPIFIGLLVLVTGIALGVWGIIKGECNSSPDCFKGSGFLTWAGGLLTLAGLIIWGIFGNGKKKQ